MRSVLPIGRGRRHFTRGLAAIALPALAAVFGPAPASAATRHVWVAAVPKTWNAVPNARDAIHGTQLHGRRDDVPDGRLPALHARLAQAGPAALRGGGAAGRFNGPLIRARVGDKLRIHFKNLDTLTGHAHSMHFHGVEYKPSSDGIWLPLFSGKGGNVKPGQQLHVPPDRRAGLGRLLALPRPLDLDGGVDRRRHVRRALDRRARASAAPIASSSSRSRRGTASRRSTGARSSATRRCSSRASASACSGT